MLFGGGGNSERRAQWRLSLHPVLPLMGGHMCHGRKLQCVGDVM